MVTQDVQASMAVTAGSVTAFCTGTVLTVGTGYGTGTVRAKAVITARVQRGPLHSLTDSLTADFLDFFDRADLARAVPIMSTDEFIRKPLQCSAVLS